jgi:transcriptional regulator with XRE-family HTH domain
MAKKKATGFAARLREQRTAAGLTQAELAERAGMHLHGVTKLEQGDREPSWVTVQALARALGVPYAVFADELAETPPAKKRKKK